MGCESPAPRAQKGPIASFEGVELRVGDHVSARAESVVVEAAEQVVARGVRLESVHGDGFVLDAPRGRLDASGRLLVLEGGVQGQGSGVLMVGERLDLRYDSSNRLVSVEVSGEVEVTKTPWKATGEQVRVDWLNRRMEVHGDVRFTDRAGVFVGGVVGIPLDGGDAVCEWCQVDVSEAGD